MYDRPMIVAHGESVVRLGGGVRGHARPGVVAKEVGDEAARAQAPGLAQVLQPGVAVEPFLLAAGVRFLGRQHMTVYRVGDLSRACTRQAKARVQQLHYRLDVNSLHRDESEDSLALNDLGRVSLRTAVPLFVDEYRKNRITGSFILIDEATFETVGAGMILGQTAP